MSLPGMRDTSDFAADERPKNWREGILMNKIRFGTPLFSLTAAMRSKSTDDPEFNWWEEEQRSYSLKVNGALNASATSLVVDKGASELKPGDMLYTASLSEALQVMSITSDTALTVIRGQANSTAAAIADNSVLVYGGSAYREGAPSPNGTAFNPVKKTNLTQIFREPVEWTRTAMHTRLRSATKGTEAEDKRRALHKHSLGIERALWVGKQFETTEASQPKRFTGGVLERIPAANVVAAGATTNLTQLENWTENFFKFGSHEKLAFCSVKTLITIAQIVRKNSEYQWGPSEEMYNLKLRKLHTPAGTICLTEMPLFGLEGGFLANDMVVMDTMNLCWRYLTGADTKYLPDREARGTDGKKAEWLTEGGLEIHHANTFHRITGITAAAKDA